MDDQTNENIIDEDFGPTLPENQAAEPGSTLSRLKQIRAEFEADHDVELDLPGYRGELLGVYKPLPWEVVRAIGMRAERNRRAPDIEVTVASDGLLNACIGFMYRDPATGVKTPLTYGGAEITGYGKPLAAALGLEHVETGREIVRAVFPDDMALVSHYGSLMDWQAERNEQDDGSVLDAAASDEAVSPTSR